MSLRILIVASWASVRAGLNALLADAADCEILGEVSGSGELERLLPEFLPDVVLCDVVGEDAMRVVETLSGGDTALVLLGEDRGDYRLLVEAILPGWAYLRKEAERAEILGAIRAAGAGLVAIDRHLAPLLTVPALGANRDTADLLPDDTLTPREYEVLQQMTQGLPNKQIAAKLTISQHTVKFHVASILAKLAATSRTEAVTLAARRGLVSL